jgi:hypothetical protein
VSKGRDRRRNGGKETKGKRQRGKIERKEPDVRDIGYICRHRARHRAVKRQEGETEEERNSGRQRWEKVERT